MEQQWRRAQPTLLLGRLYGYPYAGDPPALPFSSPKLRPAPDIPDDVGRGSHAGCVPAAHLAAAVLINILDPCIPGSQQCFQECPGIRRVQDDGQGWFAGGPASRPGTVSVAPGDVGPALAGLASRSSYGLGAVPRGGAEPDLPVLTRGVPTPGVPLKDQQRLAREERAEVDLRVFHDGTPTCIL